MKNTYTKILIILLFCCVNSSFIPKIHRSYIKIKKLNKSLISLKKEKKELLDSISARNEDIKKLKIKYYKEEIARNQLKMVKPGEQIYKVIK